MNDLLKRVVEGAVILGLAWILAGCANTANGLGQFLEGVGQDVRQMSESQLR